MNIKCNICGGDVAVSADKTFATCEYCGSTVTVPRVSDEQRAAAFNRGSHFRRIGEFDKALASYERILREDDTDAEAHWCAALCRFGIEYVEDPATYEWIPTCHRASFDSFLEDVDFKAALEHSDGLTRRLYQKEAAKIAEVQRGILATSQNEEPYDVFLCYKETGEDGQRTRDSILAQDIYYQLTDQGHRVFFSRITLEDKAGSQYEPYIFAALNSAKVMVAVGTKPEHFSAVWVRNEWSRFLALMRRDRSRVLLPCYRDMDPYDLPEQLAVLQSYDMGKIGFIQDLIRGVDKVLNAGKAAPAAAPAPVIIQTAAPAPAPAANHDSAIVMGFMDYDMGKKDSATATFRQVLMQDDTCAEAYLGLVLTNSGKDREAYLSKYSRYSGLEMTALEKKVITYRNQDAIMEALIDEFMSSKLKDLLRTITHKPPVEIFVKAIAKLRDKEIVEGFIAKGCNINDLVEHSFKNSKEKMPLLSHLMWDNPDAEALRIALECGADPNTLRSTGTSKYPPLSDAIWHNKNPEYVKILLEHGANPNVVYKGQYTDGAHFEYTPLTHALDKNLPTAAALLLEHGADPNTKWLYHSKKELSTITPLDQCIRCVSDPKILELLLARGADPTAITTSQYPDRTYAERNALSCAVINNKPKMAAVLLAHGADINAKRLYRNAYGDACIAPLTDAITKAKNADLVKLLLEHGADPNTKRPYFSEESSEAYTVLSDSIWNAKDPEILKLLLERGADLSVPTEKWYHDGRYEKHSALHEAVHYAKSVTLFTILMDHGASMDAVTTLNGREVPFRRYPYKDISDEMRFIIRRYGWKGPLFGF